MGSPVYRSQERQTIRMHQMMHRLGVDPVAFVSLDRGEAYAQARSRCMSCAAIGDCLRWLDGYAFEGDVPDFCPNLRIFHPYKVSSALADGAKAAGSIGYRGGSSGSPRCPIA